MRKLPAAFAEMQKERGYIEVLAKILTTEVTENVDDNIEKMSGKALFIFLLTYTVIAALVLLVGLFIVLKEVERSGLVMKLASCSQ